MRKLSDLIRVLLTCAACLHGLSRDVSAQLATSAWPTFQHDARHTGRATAVGPATANLKWMYQGTNGMRSSPAIGPDGTIYVGNSRSLCAVDPAAGAEIWCTFVTAAVKFSGVTVGANATVYIGARDNDLHALNTDGTEKWRYNTGHDGDVSNTANIAPDGTIYSGGTQQMHALNPDGSLKWVVVANGAIFTSSPAIAADGTIYFGTATGTLFAINPDGTVLWTYEAGRHIKYAAPSVATDGTIYVGTEAGLAAVNSDGTSRWQFPTAGRVFTSPAIALDGTVYVGSRGRVGVSPGTLYAINPDGTQKWAQPNGAEFRGAPLIGADGTIYATSGSQVLAFLPDGTPLWTYSTGARLLGALAMGADGTLYVPSNDHTLYAFAP
ncbi:MAG: PQQ-like beta-propeller repeat protein [Deltaproteobacteria bacterium]|nr:MAG: PQQ-like beta-propeller repeat protein [Deltaproteobacteria bacterium]